jgi:hypothetical protein
MEFIISINQLVDFSKGSEAKKKRIIRDQKNPNKFRIAWYQTPRASIRKCLSNNGDKVFIIDGLERLKNKITDPDKPRELQNKVASIAAMKSFLRVQIPKILKNHELTIIKSPRTKSVFINQVEIIVSPDIIFTMNYKGDKYMGGVKIHLSKGNIFEPKDSKMVAAVMQKYLETIADDYNANVLPELCMSLDVFDERIVSSPSNIDAYLDRINMTCAEVKRFWNVA